MMELEVSNVFKERVNEAAHYTSVIAPVDTTLETWSESNVDVVAGTIKLLGGVIDSIDEDSIVVKCLNKQVFMNVTEELDKNDMVDAYDFTVYETDALTGKVEAEDIDIDQAFTSQNIMLEIIVFIKPEYVYYSPYYLNQDDLSNSDESIVEGSVIRKSPLWISLSNVKSNVGGGEFIVTPHPTMRNVIWVHIQYKFDKKMTHQEFYEKNKSNIEKDISIVNDGVIHDKLIDKGFKQNSPMNIIINDISMYQDDGIMELPTVKFTADKTIDGRLLLEMFQDSCLYASPQALHEVKRRIKVNFKGVKRIKMQCQKGYKYDTTRKVCVKIAGSELATMRRARIKAVRTKKAMGSSFKVRTVRKMMKADRFRKLLGIR